MRTAPAVALVTAAALLGDTFLYTVLPVSAAKLGLDALAVGLILSLNRWVRLLTNPFAARLYERFPAGGLVLAGLLIGTASTFAYALPTVLGLFIAARLVWGLAWSFLRLGTLLAAIEGATLRTGRALGNARGIYGLGYIGGALYAPIAVETFGWTAGVIGAAILTFLLGIGPALLTSEWRREVDVDEREEAAVRRTIFDPGFLGIFLVAAAQYAAAGVIAVAGGLRIAQVFPAGATVVAIPVAATAIAGLYALAQRIAQVSWPPVAGRVADRSLVTTFTAATALTAVAIAALGALADATAFVAVGVVAFFGSITTTVAIELAIAHRTTAVDRPRVLGAYNTWADAGSGAGALAAGFLALVGVSAPFVTAAIITAATALVIPSLAPRRIVARVAQ